MEVAAAGQGRARAWRAADAAIPSARRRADREAAIALLGEVQIPDPERALGKLPARVLRRPAPAPDDRAWRCCTKPDLIIADEPTTALDVTIQAQILKLLRPLAKDRGVSVLLTTHDLGTAYEICDDITVMYAGQEVETAPVAEFFANPRHPYTARLLDSLPDPGARDAARSAARSRTCCRRPRAAASIPAARSATAQCAPSVGPPVSGGRRWCAAIIRSRCGRRRAS